MVHRNPVVLPADDFWCHVAWGPRSVHGVRWSPFASYSEVSDVDVAPLVQNEVFWLDVSMQNFKRVNILQSLQNAGDEELYWEEFEEDWIWDLKKEEVLVCSSENFFCLVK